MSMFVGEALCGEGNEIAHIDLLIGSKDGPVGVAFANALARQSEGHSNLLAVLTPNLAVKPSTVMITKVTIKGAKQAVQMFGPAQAAVAKAVAKGFKVSHLEMKGASSGRGQVLRGILLAGLSVKSIRDTTPVPTPGVRPPASRRL